MLSPLIVSQHYEEHISTPTVQLEELKFGELCHLSWFTQVCSREARCARESAWHQVPSFLGDKVMSVQHAPGLWSKSELLL